MHSLSHRVILLPLLLPTLMLSRTSRRLELRAMPGVCLPVVQLTGGHYDILVCTDRAVFVYKLTNCILAVLLFVFCVYVSVFYSVL